MLLDIIKEKSLARSIKSPQLYNDLLASSWDDINQKKEKFGDKGALIYHQKDEWDSRLSGLNFGKVEYVFGDNLPQIRKTIAEFLKKTDYEYILIRLPQSDYQWIQEFNNQGAIFLDSTVDLSISLKDLVLAKDKSAEIKLVSKEDEAQVLKIADNFRFGRFFTDPEVSYGKEAYREWIQNSIKGQAAKEVYLLKSGEKIDGFITFKYIKVGKEKLLEVPLVGKASDSSRKEVAKILLEFAKRHAIDKNCSAVLISTQGTNIAALRSYIKAGFQPFNTGVTLRIKKES